MQGHFTRLFCPFQLLASFGSQKGPVNFQWICGCFSRSRYLWGASFDGMTTLTLYSLPSPPPRSAPPGVAGVPDPPYGRWPDGSTPYVGRLAGPRPARMAEALEGKTTAPAKLRQVQGCSHKALEPKRLRYGNPCCKRSHEGGGRALELNSLAPLSVRSFTPDTNSESKRVSRGPKTELPKESFKASETPNSAASSWLGSFGWYMSPSSSGIIFAHT